MNDQLPRSSFPISTFHTAGPNDKKPNGEPLFQRVPQENIHLEIKTDENNNIHMSIHGTTSNDGMEIEVGLINLTHMQTIHGTNLGDIKAARIKCIWETKKPTLLLVFSQDPTPDQMSLLLHRWQMKLKDFEGLDQLKQTLEEILNSAKIIQPSVSQITNSNDLTPSNQPQPLSRGRRLPPTTYSGHTHRI
ncbi:hypothetical protein PGTUg99_006093 [Puccinia graminis f. sp. tritici]|uniref:Uncharacterized protein n=1 Tax=Puccinia graminis f. sp. tritici TaxID=56615 RepID=A0A5B0Q3A7_PUCGR|nr:hypothetical protein PGTUg99_006093 [Puccinia graminis f. sp. tritici]